ncbi:MAG: iron ABC transporter permease [Boseongicola sp.]|nr:iron ABC transporter permease [Boseongicola sp.]
MSVKAFLTIFVFLCTPPALLAQGFAGMGADAEGYALPSPDTRFSFPKDHAAHNDFRIEWWYVTAVLNDEEGQLYGTQWTLFRNAIRPTGRDQDQIWLGHAAVSTPKGHFYSERLARGDNGQASVTATPFRAEIDEWAMHGPDPNNAILTAQGSDFYYKLDLRSEAPFVPQGDKGFSRKSAQGLASHYYSQPFYEASGVIELPDGPIAVTGKAWMDREWSSQPLSPTQTGWDWFSLHLDSGDKLMGYQLRDTDADNYVVGTWITSDGVPRPLEPGDLVMRPTDWANVAGREVPVAWTVRLEKHTVNVSIEAVYPQSWMPTLVPYWEGPVMVNGSHSGNGYLEMTGYE